MNKFKHTLLSFVGTNDAGKLIGKNDGAILTALTNQKFDEAILLWTRTNTRETDYEKTAAYLKDEIKKRKLAKKTSLAELPIKNVTDHNQIYITLKNFTDTLPKVNVVYTAAISSGTPAMQVCWILLAESGDFSGTNPLNLVQVKDPKFGKSENIPVKIDTALPKIIRLKEEVDNLKKDLIPAATLSFTRPGLKIGDMPVPLSPVELSYYMYFVERALEGLGDEKISGLWAPAHFLDKIIKLHEAIFPSLETNRLDLIKMKKNDLGLSLTTFRGNISKLNKKIRDAVNNESISSNYEIAATGGRGYRFYGIRAEKGKFTVGD